MKAFTLAEVLITLTIIGVVAAIIIPMLMENINSHVWGEEKTNFEMKINEAMNQMKTNDALTGYATTQDFVVEFMKYMKISNTCLSGYYTNCFVPKLKASDGTEVDTVAKLRTGKDFGKTTYTSPLVGVQFNNGVQGLVAYDPDCAYVNRYDNQASATGCLSILYDLNGSSKPNQAGKDIVMYHVDKIGPTCAIEVGSSCYGAPFLPTALTIAECNEQRIDLGINGCGGIDYWAGAVAACGRVSKLPSQEQLDELANDLYSLNSCGTSTCFGLLDYVKSSSYGLPNAGQFFVWSSTEVNSSETYTRKFSSNSSNRYLKMRATPNIYAMCVIN